ncbi:endonuclease domain-containing protein [Pasteurella sp. PK-2025]|uniref:endonuclease domain-containing protein n=1 Tax=Pasteurella sp. PK-2025 TaxID=3413133 RepID=UPI003C72D883
MRETETKKLRAYANHLRWNQTDAEKVLWYHLRKRQFGGVRFLRQKIVAGYIVDFISLDKKLVIELDGSQHSENYQYDNERTQKLNTHGFKVVRFWNNDVLQRINWVLDVIWFEMFGDV